MTETAASPMTWTERGAHVFVRSGGSPGLGSVVVLGDCIVVRMIGMREAHATDGFMQLFRDFLDRIQDAMIGGVKTLPVLSGRSVFPGHCVAQKKMLTFRLRSISHTDAIVPIASEPPLRTRRG
jgi:hypothetical protein